MTETRCHSSLVGHCATRFFLRCTEFRFLLRFSLSLCFPLATLEPAMLPYSIDLVVAGNCIHVLMRSLKF
jgi:hypothetical protein